MYLLKFNVNVITHNKIEKLLFQFYFFSEKKKNLSNIGVFQLDIHNKTKLFFSSSFHHSGIARSI